VDGPPWDICLEEWSSSVVDPSGIAWTGIVAVVLAVAARSVLITLVARRRRGRPVGTAAAESARTTNQERYRVHPLAEQTAAESRQSGRTPGNRSQSYRRDGECSMTRPSGLQLPGPLGRGAEAAPPGSAGGRDCVRRHDGALGRPSGRRHGVREARRGASLRHPSLSLARGYPRGGRGRSLIRRWMR